MLKKISQIVIDNQYYCKNKYPHYNIKDTHMVTNFDNKSHTQKPTDSLGFRTIGLNPSLFMYAVL